MAKRVSFKVAKALKEAGYPQEGDWWYSKDGKLSDWLMPHQQEIYAPTYLDVWLWLWREKSIIISSEFFSYTSSWYSIIENDEIYTELHNTKDPEDAIINAIEYLCDNNLIK